MIKRIALALSFASLATFGAAQSFNIDFELGLGDFTAPSSSYAAAGLAGFWNALLPTSINLNFPNLAGLDGNATGVGFTSTRQDTEFATFETMMADDRALLEDALRLGSPMTFTGLGAGLYDIIIYGFVGADSTFTIGQQTQSITASSWTGSHVEGGSYARFSNLQLDGVSSLVIGSSGPVSGMQIVFHGANPVPEPFTMALLGGAALAGYRRIRKSRSA